MTVTAKAALLFKSFYYVVLNTTRKKLEDSKDNFPKALKECKNNFKKMTSDEENSSTRQILTTVGISMGASLVVVGLYHHFMIGPIIQDVDSVRQYIAKVRAPLNTILEKTKSLDFSSIFKNKPNDNSF